jgi:hypothetical protein
MRFDLQQLLSFALASLFALTLGAQAHAADAQKDALAELHRAAPALDARVLALALRAVKCAERTDQVEAPRTLTVIDYSIPSTKARLWVLDLERRSLVYEELVAHGRGSGEDRATDFSNDEGSHKSSLGLFVTLDTYAGKHGRSLRLRGLEPGVNDHATERAIVIHGADYVSRSFAVEHGRLGRSFGCPALTQAAAPRVIDRIAGGSPVFAYYPDAHWLEGSRFLGRCDEAVGE